MKKLILVFVLISTIGFAQESITKNLGDFNQLKVYNGLDVELKKGSESKIEITGSQAEDVTIKNSNGTLKIRLKFPERFTSDDVNIVVYYSKDIDILDANEGAEIFSEEKIKQSHLEVKVQEGAKIDLDIKVKHLEVKCVTGGIINLEGKATNQTIEATTGGVYDGYNLQSITVMVTAASGAKAEVDAKELLDAKVRFGGNIYYKGTPETIKSKKIIGGTIKHVD
ncbi:Putative auto-transporter adhesin, head GIN domain [Lutibacter oricola]|uniref:Putative auto-transporter adhesin, head GIN domain n=1 Tax=Lutibacter oricola TaxID=762486 RepID=A0A1H2QQ75_9FLAO|nr:head GIN domain-containing protein [Lutibacter oricola]SDW09058.1 Putative auto-transporter adhesin, head GIN domain [Lutibacter oricola]